MVSRALIWLASLWTCALVTYATYQVFCHPSTVSDAAATSYVALVGLPSVVAGWYHREKVKIAAMVGNP